jgi:fumarylacetoacetase
MTSSLPGYASHFGLSNIPFGIASSAQHSKPQCATRYEDDVIFLADIVQDLGDIQDLPKDVFKQPTLNEFAALPRSVHQAVRERVQQLLKSSGIASSAIEPIADVTMHLPVQCNDFSDFSCSSDHVENASEAMTGNRSHPPAFFYQPVGYAGRCSSLDVSGTSQVRPLGQYWSGKPGNSEIVFGPSKRMDYELELGAIIGKPLPRRQRLLAKDAAEHIFGFVLVNDWSGKYCILKGTFYMRLTCDNSSRYSRLRDESSWTTQWQESRHKLVSMGRHTRRAGSLPHSLNPSKRQRANTTIPIRFWP